MKVLLLRTFACIAMIAITWAATSTIMAQFPRSRGIVVPVATISAPVNAIKPGYCHAVNCNPFIVNGSCSLSRQCSIDNPDSEITMKVLLLRTFACIAMIAITWAATSTIMAQFPRSRGIVVPVATISAPVLSQTPDNPQVNISRTSPNNGSEVTPNSRRASPRVPLAKPIATFSIPKMDIQLDDSNVHVFATAAMNDQRPGLTYYWAIQVFDLNGTALTRWAYLGQPFTMNGGTQLSPSFEEIVPVPIGESFVEVSIYGLPQGIKPNILMDPKNAEGWQIVKNNRHIAR